MHRLSHPVLEATLEKLEGAYAVNTLRAYRADVENFIGFCKENHFAPFPATPLSVSGFIAELTLSGVKSASIRRAVAGIATIHQMSRLEDPTKDPDVLLAMRRMHRTLGRAAKQAGAIDAGLLEALLAACDSSLRGLRNRALLLIGFENLLRRSELIVLEAEDLKPRKILLRKSKTDPQGVGRWLSLSAKTDRAIRDWLEASGIKEGAIFRGVDANGDLTQRMDPGQVSRILKRLAKKANLDPEVISGHSLRVGAAQDLLLRGASLPMIMQRGRWSKTDTMMRYLENAPAIDPESIEGTDSEFGPAPGHSRRYTR